MNTQNNFSGSECVVYFVLWNVTLKDIYVLKVHNMPKNFKKLHYENLITCRYTIAYVRFFRASRPRCYYGCYEEWQRRRTGPSL